MMMSSQRENGVLVQWDDAKGYGFIAPQGGGAKRFVHIKAFGMRARRPFVGERLSFVAGSDAQGKPRALQVQSLEPRAPAAAAPAARSSAAGAASGGSASLWLVPAFASLVLVCQLAFELPRAVWGAYFSMSMASFLVYALDKRAARLRQWRVAEGTLHLLALACGWPGALLAQQTLRHKSSKPAFRRVFWLMVLLNVLGFSLLFTPLGRWLLAGLRPWLNL